ncbi:hypothetical protein M885DRAFT_534300 [Pelagophyceae sp. CCMP2097]|nr:hypothetical protein M885DRAFT_534300 [Pelagophyceae sp. CCMP2097]
MAAVEDGAVTELFVQLRRLCGGNKHDKVALHCDVILAALPGDEAATKVKVVALAKKGRFEDGLAAAEAGGDALAAERAYCAYRLGRLDDALALARSAGASTLAAHVEAQVLYKREAYGDAAACYEAVVKRGGELTADDGAELHANRFAAYARAGYGETAVAGDGATIDALCASRKQARRQYELAHNAACALVDARRPGVALRVLENALPADGAAADADEEDLEPLRAQRAACEVLAGDAAAAAAGCRRLLKSKPASSATLAAVVTTLFAARDGADLFDSHKRLKPLVAACDDASKAAEMGLSAQQKASLKLDWAKLLLNMGKSAEAAAALNGVFDVADEGAPWRPKLAADVALLRAWMAVRGKTLATQKRRGSAAGDPAEEAALMFAAVEGLVADASGMDVDVLRFALAQCAASSGDFAGAVVILEASALRDAPGVASARCELKLAAGDVDGARAALATVDVSAESADIVLALAVHQLEVGDASGAAATLAALHARGGGDARVLAALAVATSWFDADEAERLLDAGDLDDAGDVDAEALFDLPAPRAKRAGGKRSEHAQVGGDAAPARSRDAVLRRRARQRTAYLVRLAAAGKYDARAPPVPDAERWIAKKQRSYNKRGKKNRGKFVGAQGGDANVKDVAKLDAFARKIKAAADAAAAVDEAANAILQGRGKKGGRQQRKRK